MEDVSKSPMSKQIVKSKTKRGQCFHQAFWRTQIFMILKICYDGYFQVTHVEADREVEDETRADYLAFFLTRFTCGGR